MCCNEEKSEIIKHKNQEKIYTKPWFWVCITIIVYCVTRPHVKVYCGNGCGNSNNGVNKKD